MTEHCVRFQNENNIPPERLVQAGHDFWLTRNHHGCGFWDGEWEEPQATELTEASKKFGEFGLYVHNDKLVH